MPTQPAAMSKRHGLGSQLATTQLFILEWKQFALRARKTLCQKTSFSDFSLPVVVEMLPGSCDSILRFDTKLDGKEP